MRFLNTKFFNGYFIGDFSPSLYTSRDVDVGIIHCPKGHKADGHYHKIATEYNIIVSGTAIINETILLDGDIFVYEPGDRAEVEYVTDTDLVVIKLPSIKNDKYY